VRYYSIVITDPNTEQVFRPPGFASLNLPFSYGSFLNGKTLSNAWNVEINVPVVEAALPSGDAWVRVWGVSLAEIAQASDLNNQLISVYAGMQKGLPLANPAQAGLIVQGYVLQAFGNWIGTDQTLDLIIQPGPPPTGAALTTPTPRNLTLNWLAGQPLSAALATTLSTAYPGLQQQINISSNLVRADNQVGYYANLSQLAQFVKQVTRSMLGGTYSGVAIMLANNTLSAYDGTTTGTAASPQTLLAFQDLIGQPTWINSPNISVKTVMRADLKVGQQFKLPPAIITNTQQANSYVANQKAAFQGGFQVQSMFHYGNLRQPDAASWATVIEGTPIAQPQDDFGVSTFAGF
jgi:hypothetical protein